MAIWLCLKIGYKYPLKTWTFNREHDDSAVDFEMPTHGCPRDMNPRQS